MTHREKIEGYLARQPHMCDDCLATRLGISQRQNVYRICSKSENIDVSRSQCVNCGKVKNCRSLSGSPLRSPRPGDRKRNAKGSGNYVREADLRERFNESIRLALRVAPSDYYGELSFEGLLQLKSGYARIHDIITLKLTFALVDRIAARMKLGSSEQLGIREAVNQAHPNASGFDVDSCKPNLIGELKGSIPMNAGERFGAAQVKGLTNDALQMLGMPPLGKSLKDLSPRSKVFRKDRDRAIKFLGLYDSPNVRMATAAWRESFCKAHGHELVRDLPERAGLSPKYIYLVYLKPEEVVS